MRYIYDGNFIKGKFLSRPNRFIGEVEVNGEVLICHVKNTGRMTEILTPGKKCFIMEAKNPNRKTKYDLITIEHDGILVNLDSQIPNKVVADAFLNSEIRDWENPDGIQREVTVGKSRLDMKVLKGGEKLFVEVKGVDLIKDGNHAMFPDAVTIRGSRHLKELEELVRMGYKAMAIFLIAREDAVDFRPHFEMDPVFTKTFYEVLENGVQARAYLTKVGYNYIEFGKEIPILSKGEVFLDK